jgi:hypothetical protein
VVGGSLKYSISVPSGKDVFLYVQKYLLVVVAMC